MAVKSAPVKMAECTVTGAVPVDFRTMDCVEAVLTCTSPNTTLVVLMASVGTAAFNCKAKLLETLPDVAVSVTACAVATDATIAVNPALVALAGTVTVAGTETAASLLDRLTLRPPLGAADVRVTVQASIPEPVNDGFVQESALNAAAGAEVAAVPFPLRLTAAEPPGNAVLEMVSRSVAAPSADGLNCTLKPYVPPPAMTRGRLPCATMEKDFPVRLS